MGGQPKLRTQHPNRRDNATFGKYQLDNKKLAKNVLSFTHTNGHSVSDFPAYKIGNSLKGVILSILNGMPVNFDELESEDVSAFNLVMKKTGCQFKNPITNNGDALMTRLEILIGEIDAGNDSKAIKTELSQTLNALQQAKLISAKQVKEATHRWVMS